LLPEKFHKEIVMLKTLMITTAIGGLMIGAAVAEGTPPAGSSPKPPAAAQTQPAKPDAAAKPDTAAKPDMPAKSDMSAKPDAAKPSMAGGSPKVINSQKPDQWLASKFKGTDVVGADDKKIGDVSDILFDKTGKVEAFIVSVGGFLGMGAKDVAVEPSSFQVVAGDKSKNEPDKLKLSMTQEQLKTAAAFEPYQAPRTTTGMAPGSSSRPAPASPPPTGAPAQR
jgi:hypothetical protein